MNSKRLLRYAASAMVGLSLVFGTVGAAYAAKTIKIAFLGSQTDEDWEGALVFKDYVEGRTNGEVKVEVYHSGQFCGNFRECIEGVQSGALEVTISTIGGFGNLWGPGQVLDLPYLFRDDRVAECVFDSSFTTELRDEVLKSIPGMRLMVVSNTGGWRNFATVNKQVKTPADVQGQKIRTIPADIQKELVKLLGGNPTPIAWPEVYTSLATGVVEGTKNGITDIVSMKFEDHLKYITLDGHAYMAALWWMNDATWKGFSKAEKRVVHDGFQHLKTVTRASPMRRKVDAIETFKKAGGSVYVPTPAEKKAFQQAAKPMEKWFVDKYGDEWLTKVRASITACEKQIDAEIG
ncbi:MAG: TRAP transporter substrate-binding protein DctP [Pseudomonadota bacterium]